VYATEVAQYDWGSPIGYKTVAFATPRNAAECLVYTSSKVD
jgi:hypothetical protein